jgi:hypothetical protein
VLPHSFHASATTDYGLLAGSAHGNAIAQARELLKLCIPQSQAGDADVRDSTES